MVEVEDISLIPRTIQCSYKAVTDSKFRFYPIGLFPSSVCLPVSQWDDETYQSYAEEGGSGGWEDERWSSQATIQRRGTRKVAENAEEEEEEADNAERNDGDRDVSGRGNNEADFPPIIYPVNAQAGVEAGARSNARVDLVGEELERRRKGKGIYIPEIHGPRPLGPDRHVMPSGSDSCDPLNQNPTRHSSPVRSESADADSIAGPCKKRGQTVEVPIVISEGTDQDFDMGGDVASGGDQQPFTAQAAGTVKEEKHRMEEVPRKEEARNKGKKPMAQEEAGATVGGVEKKRRIGEEEAVQRRAKSAQSEGSKGTSVSVPPGFKKLHVLKVKQPLGASSPFGKLQKGGFKFLRRSSSSATSVPKPEPAPKKNTPLASLPDKEIVDLASNVGVSKPLSEEQISRLRKAEKDRAST